MRFLSLISLTCALLTVVSAVPFMENAGQYSIIQVRAFSPGASDVGSLLAAIVGASIGGASSDIFSSSGTVASSASAALSDPSSLSASLSDPSSLSG